MIGTLEVQNLNISFQHDRFIFSALSLDQSEIPIHYYLEIETFHHLNTYYCWWRYDSVGITCSQFTSKLISKKEVYILK